LSFLSIEKERPPFAAAASKRRQYERNSPQGDYNESYFNLNGAQNSLCHSKMHVPYRIKKQFFASIVLKIRKEEKEDKINTYRDRWYPCACEWP
jgi:hypothetical protein